MVSREDAISDFVTHLKAYTANARAPPTYKDLQSRSGVHLFHKYSLCDISVIVSVNGSRERHDTDSDAGNCLILQYAYHHATILCLCFGGLVIIDLSRLTHRSRSQYPRQWDVCFLTQNIRHIVGTVLAELLVHFRAAGR